MEMSEIKNWAARIRERKQNIDKKPVVAAYGLVNAGKSYLLNMLTAPKNADEYFKTADRRETVAIKEFESEKYIYLDTPGLDAQRQDDNISEEAVLNADIVLFVHQPQGELDASEMAFLKALKSSMGDCAEKHVVIVISKAEKEPKEKISTIMGKIREQCKKHLGIEFSVFSVSSTFYKKGVNENKNKLVAESHVTDLIEYLDLLRPEVQDARKARLHHEREMLVHAVDATIKGLKEQKQAIHKDARKKFSDFSESMKNFRNILERYEKEFG